MKVLLVVLIVAAVTQAANINLDNLKSSDFNFPSSVLRFGDVRIADGEAARPHQFPYQVAIGTFINETNSRFCGGSLISPTAVLTAAHCVDEAKMVYVMLGTHNLTDIGSAQLFLNVTDFKIHPSWNLTSRIGDIAIIKLPEAVKLNENITLINLPSSSDNLFENETATISGWGQTSDSSNMTSNILRFTSNTVMTNKECSDAYGPGIQNSHLCVRGNQDKSPCVGDSGSPLIVSKNNVTTQIGLFSLTHNNGCTIGKPAVYTRITSYLDWIKENSSITIKMSKYLFIIQFVLFVYSKIR